MVGRTLPGALLFGSGFCALVYQTAWLRQFRLIFGASTFATAAVLAIFMGGLGLGSALLGKRADRHPQPLRFYGNLELMIAASAALSPLLLWLIAKVYFALGGSVVLGLPGASVVRLILSTLVLGVPTILMGGTLPAAARAVETDDDEGRRRLALLYGMNTLGAVAGTLLSTFWLLEALGNRGTLFVAVAINVVVAVIAKGAGGRAQGAGDEREGGGAAEKRILIAAAVVGFAFLLMELVWYRMLAPLLGGSTFTFGLILAIALLGIGLGGAAYAFWSGNRRATPAGFALTCSLEAAAIAIPFALGDRIAVLANLLRGVGAEGFGGYVFGWTVVTAIVVFPAAVVAGVQFPLLISLLGSGDENVGHQVGLAYAWNTAGAIAGSLAGGFGILPLLTAPGTWRLVVVLLAITAIAFSWRSTLIAVAAVALTFTLGPTAVWRHSGIGAGRAPAHDSPNAIREWEYRNRRQLVWDVDGRESSVALIDGSDYAFVVNGKVDGSARGDAGTQIMAGLVGAILHPNPKRALVVGLGTGSTAGWYGAVPSMERVDVVELEPAILRVAAACAPVNRDVLHNKKVHIRIADAREVLLTTRDTYDLIFSEPSNPYRAGIASLFTQEFYRAAAARLRERGIFLQWVQAYDIDSQTIRTIYATLGSVFPFVETWTTDSGDLLLVATRQPLAHDAARQRVAQEPFRSALSNAWRVESFEGFLGHFLARDTLARTLAKNEELNTDDKTPIEFGFARGLGGKERFDMNQLAALARTRGEDRPAIGGVDWNRYYAERATMPWVNALPAQTTAELQARHNASVDFDNARLDNVAAAWRAHRWTPVNSGELAAIGDSLADGGDDAAIAFAERLRPLRPIDADAIEARLAFRKGNHALSAALCEKVFTASRSNPWPTVDLVGRTLDVANVLGQQHAFSAPLVRALEKPFAAGQWNDTRRGYRAQIAIDMEGCGPHAIAALRALEPWPPWDETMLKARADCLGKKGDLEEFRRSEPAPLQ
ncbi:MAG TPA: fused MFS/spermidine synthase [Thermoanaerobaculia bacterium]|nr:fused MFS/spermidine synthase [Thermoanaerobaculia bacterium]